MRKYLVHFFVLMLLAAQCFGQSELLDLRRQYLSSIVIGETLPHDLTQVEHFLIQSKEGVDIPLEYGLRLVTNPSNEMLWLEKIEEFNDRGGVYSWKVLDVLELPAIGTKQVLVLRYCSIGDDFDPEVVAVFEQQDREYLRSATSVWRANRLAGKFESIPSKGVRCENPAWNIP